METEMESNTAIPVDQGSDLGSNGALDLPPPYQLHSTSELLDSSATVLGTLRCYVSGPVMVSSLTYNRKRHHQHHLLIQERRPTFTPGALDVN